MKQILANHIPLEFSLNPFNTPSKVNAGITAATAPAEANKMRQANIAKLESDCNKATGNRCDVVTLYSGGQYDLYE